MENIDNKEFIEIFISDTNGTLEELEMLLLKAESDSYSADIVDEIFRAMHSMKGSAATMGYENMASLSHAMEDIFAEIRKSGADNIDSSWLTSMLLVCKDFLMEELKKIQSGKEADGDAGALVKEIKSHKGFIKQYEELPNNTINENFAAREIMEYGIPPQENFQTYYAKIFFEKDSGMLNVRALILVERIGECMMIREHIPYELTNEKSEDVISKKGFQIMFDSELEIEKVRKFIENNALCVAKLELSSVSSDDTIAKEEEEKKYEKAVKTGEERKTANDVKISKGSISVSVEKLDKLMDITSEVIITQELLIQNPDLRGIELQNFEKVARQFKKISNELQDIVMSLRMLPISQVFMKMKRIVRDASEKLGKKIELSIVGETTEVDKNIIEMISDPLMHLIRNSIDHGIEIPEKRVEAGKSETGNITLEARHVGSEVWIEVIDDGGGLNKEKIYEKAVENGLTEKMMSELKDIEIYNFIFAPGFSTKEETTEYSGRGVGMDVVYKNLEKLHGSVSIEKTSSKGTTIILKIPLTLAIINGMTVKVGNSKYTVPVESIIEIMALKAENIIISTDGQEIINIRNRYYPTVRLHEKFKINTKVKKLTDGMGLIIQTAEGDICIFTDALVGEQQMVVKPLPDYLKKVKGVAGCSLLGDGTISLILDTDKLF